MSEITLPTQTSTVLRHIQRIDSYEDIVQLVNENTTIDSPYIKAAIIAIIEEHMGFITRGADVLLSDDPAANTDCITVPTTLYNQQGTDLRLTLIYANKVMYATLEQVTVNRVGIRGRVG